MSFLHCFSAISMAHLLAVPITSRIKKSLLLSKPFIDYPIGGASPLLMAEHRQVISRISKGSQNILIYNFVITNLPLLSAKAAARVEVFLPEHLPWHALVRRRHWLKPLKGNRSCYRSL